jgi:pimeloyl-ACP methyl ester carboxylesterase
MSIRRRYGLVFLLVLLQFLVAACVPPPATIDRNSKASPVADRLVVRGGELDYRVTGTGAPVLLIHGSVFADAFETFRNEPALANYQLITYHRRGYAASTRATGPVSVEQQAADAIALLDRLNIKRAHIVGHSYGGSIALQIAAMHPQRVASVAVLEPVVPAFGAVDIKLVDELKGFGSINTEQAVRDAVTFIEVERPSLEQWKFASEDIGKLRMPVLAVIGANSTAASRESHEALLRAVPHAEALVVSGTGHALQLQQPKVVADGIAVFLQKNALK